MNRLVNSVFNNATLYGAFQRIVSTNKARERVQDLIRLDSHQSVLDFGCGLGHRSRSFRGQIYLGIDPLANCIRSARKNFERERVKFLVGDQKTLKELPDESFDLLFGIGVLHHMTEPEVAELAEHSVTVLKSGGRLFFLEPLLEGDTSILARFIINLDRGQMSRDTDGYKKHFLASGFTVSTYPLENLLRIPYRHVVVEGYKI